MTTSKNGWLNSSLWSTETSIITLSVLYGTDQQDVQRAMLHELRRIYTDTERIDVTIIRCEEIETEDEDTFFEGIFIP